MIYHLLKRPIRRIPETGKVEWECHCGLRAALPPQPVPAGTAIQIPNNSEAIIECAGCYAGEDEDGDTPPPVGAGVNERELRPTFDQDLGESEDDGAAPEEEDEEQDGKTLTEEREEFPE